MKRIFLFLLLQAFTINFLMAQSGTLLLKSGEKGLYVEHKIAPKENFYSIGRMFNVSPKNLASFNSLDMAKGLSIGQVIRVPLTDSNFSQAVSEGMPVFATAEENESLAKISNVNNKVSIGNLKMWNELDAENAGNKRKLIVGFLTSGELAKANHIVIVAKPGVTTSAETIQKPEVVTENPVTIANENAKKVENVVEQKDKPGKEEAKEVVKTEPSINSGPGYFKNNFEQQLKVYPASKEVTVTSGIFKTASGWKDAKFYALMDGVDPGTVVKVTNPSNNKTIYAKVLGAMKGIRQNKGLDLRISDAALSELQISDSDKFIVKVNY
ncbi:MAG: LysM peptidoglycan-binding domain-containing protein [Bacteroidetes bacterium]|nr:LysM peptidoglycan-binding domain-containing protein [Bacteroidota bacterium]MBS1632466.1 LysM peptidoglycan-binding domain-containing protein [Bacteroidota bacterium]